MTYNAIRALETLEREIAAARALLDQLFSAWDATVRPNGTHQDASKLSSMTKKQLIDLVETLRCVPTGRSTPPKKEECARVLLTSTECQHIIWEDLAVLIREAFTSRGLKCNMSTRSLQWYPPSKGFMALPRIRIGAASLQRSDGTLP